MKTIRWVIGQVDRAWPKCIAENTGTVQMHAMHIPGFVGLIKEYRNLSHL
jgi:hypothetical protein